MKIWDDEDDQESLADLEKARERKRQRGLPIDDNEMAGAMLMGIVMSIGTILFLIAAVRLLIMVKDWWHG